MGLSNFSAFLYQPFISSCIWCMTILSAIRAAPRLPSLQMLKSTFLNPTAVILCLNLLRIDQQHSVPGIEHDNNVQHPNQHRTWYYPHSQPTTLRQGLELGLLYTGSSKGFNMTNEQPNRSYSKHQHSSSKAHLIPVATSRQNPD